VVLSAIAAPHHPHPPRVGSHGLELRRSGCSSVTPRSSHLRRPGRSHPRPGLQHRLIPALFGCNLAGYENLFEEKTSLFAELLKGGPVTWQGKTRASLHDQDVVPHTESGPFPAWIGVGGSPQSVIRAAHYGFSLMLAIIGGSPARFAPFSQLFQQALDRFGRAPLPVGVHSPGHVAVTDEKAREEFWPCYLEVIRSVSKTRGFAIPTKESFLYEAGPQGTLYVGSPETVAQKIAANLPALGATRFDLKYGMGGLSHHALMTNIELYGTQVIPRVRELLAANSA